MNTLLNKRSFILFAGVILLFLFSIFCLLSVKKTPTIQNQPIAKTIAGLPVHLTIPVIQIDTRVQHVGLTPDGNMEVPNNTIDVGWFKLGSRPGEKGSAVISGHMNGKNGEAGVFAQLSTLKKGDTGTITDDQGTTLTFIVRDIRLYDPGYAEEIFSENNTAHLNLITCDGVWDEAKSSYTKRLVVFSDIIP